MGGSVKKITAVFLCVFLCMTNVELYATEMDDAVSGRIGNGTDTVVDETIVDETTSLYLSERESIGVSSEETTEIEEAETSELEVNESNEPELTDHLNIHSAFPRQAHHWLPSWIRECCHSHHPSS